MFVQIQRNNFACLKFECMGETLVQGCGVYLGSYLVDFNPFDVASSSMRLHHTHILFAGPIPEKLTQVLEAERGSPREFQPLPFHYVEISRLIFDQYATQPIFSFLWLQLLKFTHSHPCPSPAKLQLITFSLVF